MIKRALRHYSEMPTVLKRTTDVTLSFVLFLLVPILYLTSPLLGINFGIDGEAVSPIEFQEKLRETHLLELSVIIGTISLISAVSLLKKKRWTRLLVPTATLLGITICLIYGIKESDGSLLGAVILSILFAWIGYTYLRNDEVNRFYENLPNA